MGLFNCKRGSHPLTSTNSWMRAVVRTSTLVNFSLMNEHRDNMFLCHYKLFALKNGEKEPSVRFLEHLPRSGDSTIGCLSRFLGGCDEKAMAWDFDGLEVVFFYLRAIRTQPNCS